MLTGVDRFEQHLILAVPLLFSKIWSVTGHNPARTPHTRDELGGNTHNVISAGVNERTVNQ